MLDRYKPFANQIAKLTYLIHDRKRFRLTLKSAFGDDFSMGEPTRLKMIAERLNLSESTISRALNNYNDISAETKTVVRKMAEKLDYGQYSCKTTCFWQIRNDWICNAVQSNQITGQFINELMAGIAKPKENMDGTCVLLQSSEEEIKFLKKSHALVT